MNVIKFPESKIANRKNLLYKHTEKLDEAYLILDRLHGELSVIEEQTYNLEQEYNEKLAEYADLIPADELDVVLLTYSTRALVVDNVDGSFTIKWGEEGTPHLIEIIEDEEE